ncbi:hypothetical protein TorRG33x02_226390, partial [Trema orientale]
MFKLISLVSKRKAKAFLSALFVDTNIIRECFNPVSGILPTFGICFNFLFFQLKMMVIIKDSYLSSKYYVLKMFVSIYVVNILRFMCFLHESLCQLYGRMREPIWLLCFPLFLFV